MHFLAERPTRGNGFLDLPRSVEEMFNRFWNGYVPASAESWRPAADVIETPQAYLVRMEIPGVDPALIDVTLVGETLTIRGEKKLEEPADEQTWCHSERVAGRFERSFVLRKPVADEQVEASASNGILTVRVTKAKEAQPRKIQVRAG